MLTLFLVCAFVGTGVLALQFLFGAVGGHDGADGLHHDVGHGHHDSAGHALWFLSVRSLAAFFAFFGVAGFFALRAGWLTGVALGASVVLGAVASAAVSFLQRSMQRLESDGTLRLENAVGLDATVYVAIPADGAGKVLLNVQGRRVELTAVTDGQALPSGTAVTVLAVRESGVLEVCPASAILPPEV
jgi:membrane protein implicated in regulation of membrane protease activity